MNKIKGRYIYALTNKGEVIYVGQTTNLYVRLSRHKKNKDFDNFLILKKLEDHENIDEFEDKFIKYFDPILNVTLNKGCKCYISLYEACAFYDVDYLQLVNDLQRNEIKPIFSDKYECIQLTRVLASNELKKKGEYHWFATGKERGELLNG